MMVDDLVGGDPVQPRSEPAAAPPKAVDALQCRFERGGADVLGGLPVSRASPGEGVDLRKVVAVELGEGVDVHPGALGEVALDCMRQVGPLVPDAGAVASG